MWKRVRFRSCELKPVIVRHVSEAVVRPEGDRRFCDFSRVERARRRVARGGVRSPEVGDDRAGGEDAGRHVPEGAVVGTAEQRINC